MNVREDAGEWVSYSRRANASFFSELDVLLRALDRFFTIDNLAASDEDLTIKNCYEELGTVRDTILRVLAILEVVIPESRKNAYWFQKFAETKLLTARKRDVFRESLYRQDTPEKSLSLLYDSFINLKGIISDLMRSGSISYAGFMTIGRIISKDIRENIFFSPFAMEISPEFDVIESPAISDVVRAIKDRELKKNVSLIFVSLFRFLRFLNCVEVATERSVPLNSSIAVLMMIRIEIPLFQGIAERAARASDDERLAAVLNSLSYMSSMEGRRVFEVELRDIQRKKMSPQFRGRLESCHGILTNLVEHGILQLAQFFNPGLSEEEIFPDYASRLQQSIRLREDLVALCELLTRFDAAAESSGWRRLFESLVCYMVYFESFTLRLLRYDDYEEFSLFCNGMKAVKLETVETPEFRRMVERIRHFRIFVETTLRHVENRTELSNKPVDMERVEDLLRQYI